jgi:dCMP deaminase
MNNTWVSYFRELAKTVATKSKDRETNIGAVIVGNDKEIVSTGYNSFPRGLNDDVEERYLRPEKYYWMEHAERNAIYNAARIGVSTKGCSLFLDHWFPCTECTRAIINSGITTIYCDRLSDSKRSTTYDESFKRSIEMLNEANIKIVYYETSK